MEIEQKEHFCIPADNAMMKKTSYFCTQNSRRFKIQKDSGFRRSYEFMS